MNFLESNGVMRQSRIGRAMISWTEAVPTESGWYWWREDKDNRANCVEVGPESCPLEELSVFLRNRCRSLDNWGGEWWPERIKEPVQPERDTQ